MTLYLFGAGAYFAFLLFSQFRDQECSKTDFKSWLVVTLASALWLLAIPISLIEIRFKAQAKVRIKDFEKLTNSQLNSQQIESVTVKQKELDSNTLAQLTPENT